MNDALKIQISAFVDGELPDNESELLLRRLCHDHEFRQQLEQYLLVGRLIRGERDTRGIRDLRSRISACIAAESGEEAPLLAPPATIQPSRFMRPVAGVAIAASVAVMALIGLRQIDLVDDATVSASTIDLAAIAIDDAPSYTEPLVEEFLSDVPSDMLTQYYLHHGERSADLGANGILTRLVTLELREGELVEIAPPAGAGEQPADEGSVDAPSSRPQ